MDIGTIILVYNELDNLKECVNSAKLFSNTILIGIDSKSNKQTKQWVINNSIPFIEFEFQNNISEVYNKLKKELDNDWVLILDPDEKILPEYSKNLQKAIDLANVHEADCIACKRLNWKDKFLYKIDKTKPVETVYRLIKNNPKIQFYGRINSTIVNAKKIIETNLIRIEHYYMYKPAELLNERNILKNELLSIEQAEGTYNIKNDIIQNNINSTKKTYKL